MTAATVEDVETAIGRPVSSDAELRQIEWWLSGVEILIQSRLGDLSALDQDVLRYVEAEAEAARLGIWSTEFEMPWDYRRAH